MSKLLHKIALVTGAGQGIGAACSNVLAEEGATVVVSDINLASAQSTADQIVEQGGKAVAVELDVSDESSWEAVSASVFERYGRLDILVNNAGIFKQMDFEATTLADWNTMLDINLTGSFLGVRSAVALMKQNIDSSSIINIASINGLSSGAAERCAAYCAAKAGVRLLSKAVALECGRKGYGIRVNAICPGGVNTAMNDELNEQSLRAKATGHPIGRMAEPMDIAKAVLFLASDDASFITGSDFVVDGGVTAGFIGGVYPEVGSG